jgi:ABC transporter substrate binding protein
MASNIERRKFLAALGGAAIAWPLAARAQQAERVRRIGVLMNFGADDAEGQVRLAAFLQGLQETGWAVGRNVRIDLRWGAANNELYRKYAAELVALAPDVILASATPSVQALQHANRTVPVVFAMVGDPVGMGVVASLARPGGNTTGFTPNEFGFSAKWVELLKEIAPRVTRVAVLRDLTIGPAQLSAIQAVAPSFGVVRCKMTASLRATATLALRSPFRLASLIPQAFSADHFGTRVSSTLGSVCRTLGLTQGVCRASVHTPRDRWLAQPDSPRCRRRVRRCFRRQGSRYRRGM